MSGRIAEFRERGCDVLGVSTDPVETHARWLTATSKEGGLGPLEFPLASDPDGSVCRQYGVYEERQHVALRGLFIIDPNGVLQYQVVHSLSVGRGSDEVLRVLEALQIGGLCPAERDLGGPVLDVAAQLGPNRVVGPYQIEAEVGSGAFGSVYRARDKLLDRTVALKVFRDSDAARAESWLEEARAAAALNHPNVCLVYSVDTSNGAAMIVMEYVPGEPLAACLEGGPLSEQRAASLGRQMASGMAAAHEAGVVHGDLKPANLMVTPGDGVKIMDFGLSRRVAAQPYAETVVLDQDTSSGLYGTPGYMAPEQARGERATAASDVFALGLVIHEMLTGRPVMQGGHVLELLRSVERFDASHALDSIPERFAAILAGALTRDPRQRSSMAEIAERL